MSGIIRNSIRIAAAVLVAATGTAAAVFSQCDTWRAESIQDQFSEEHMRVTIPGMEESCTILWISDMHICSYPEDPDVTEENMPAAQERYELLRDDVGSTSLENWDYLSASVDSSGADYVVFGADMVDYASQANLDALREGLEKVRIPWMYIRADHDYGRWFTDMGIKEMRKLHRKIAPQNKIWVQRFEAFTIVGLDNTTTAVTEETLQQFTEICEEGKPVILCTHVPIDQRKNVSVSGQSGALGENVTLAEASRAGWGDRVLCWGEGDEYDASEGTVMGRLMDLIYAQDSPVIAVLAGHLHLSWEGNLTDTCVEHVFSAAYEKHIGIITVNG